MAKLNTPVDITVFLDEQGYSVTTEDDILIIQDEDGLNMFAVVDETQIEFMVDLCSVNDLDTSKLEEIYGKILGIDSSDPDDHHIVLVDSLATENLDSNELLLALDSLAVNVVTAHELLLSHLKQK